MMDLTYGIGKRKIVNPSSAKELNSLYYDVKYSSAEDALSAGVELTERIANEGQVLLKNNGVLPLGSGAKVTPFGFLYMHPNYGPYVGSAKVNSESEHLISPKEALSEVFSVNGETEKAMSGALPLGLTVSGYETDFDYDAYFRPSVIEYNPVIYVGTERSCTQSIGLVFLGRQGGEAGDDYTADLTYEQLYDGSPHGAALSQHERNIVRFAKENCDKVVVILNGTNPLELSPISAAGAELEADAIIWIGGAGSAGFKSMTNILCGKVNPSGRLVDIFAENYLNDPVYANYGSRSKYTNITPDVYANAIQNTFVEYQEGVYNGYRYYETADIMDSSYDYSEAVIYAFGHGLSYSRLTQQIESFEYDNETVTMKVRVANEFGQKGKDVVQVYYSAPYTETTKMYGIEKPSQVLAGFGKSKELSAGDTDLVTISFAIEDMASYSSSRYNKDGSQGCYVLEEGEYTVSLKINSHDIVETRTLNIDETIWYDAENPRRSDLPENVPINRFEEVTRYMMERTVPLSRADWTGTQPSAPTNFVAPQFVLDDVMNNKTFNPEKDENLGDAEGSLVYNDNAPTEKADNGLVLSELRGLDYNDEKWDKLLDQIDYSADDLMHLLTRGYMQTHAVKSIGKPLTAERDSPLGLTVNLVDADFDQTPHCCYSSAPVLAATYNISLAKEFGETVAQEAMHHNDGNLPISGWYAPAVNIHRGPFGSRHNEYYSEDPLVSGLIAAAVTEGAASGGLAVIIKHFACNNQDSTREGLNTWMTEQTLREIYLRPYEICIKTAKMTVKYINENGLEATALMNATQGIMTAKNSIGSTLCNANRALTVDVLRNEWGFRGMVITDIVIAGNQKSENLITKFLRGGVNVVMQYRNYKDAQSFTSNTIKNIVREHVHEICYMTVNSAAMQGVAPGGTVKYGLSAWKKLLIAAWSGAGVFILVMTVVSIHIHKKKRGTSK